ncbi:hypothetical protein [Elizabethkingia anophelis]|uniref:hypothetical protein n=1 Tax=Elizabethkingia anophelis TaxID=1117645 RepID=UPI001370D8B0|nr:hypothetical protein [Elizabethkingia anophelis]MCT4121954.1 hypothetical protein [Elizabethkingia anophelis]MCW2463773.1 hypothetical protein [Elizabethkingia anophelis]MCW2467457.1 hypothetical protein [Elizabethkingia anophelis]MCW2470395.1 hypothetical protein [Elizabethkingia anophelis]MYY41073.1 hypothetical protein [Elizabethkingia anophelis]
MRNFLVFLLTGLFLLFVVESKLHVRTFQNCKLAHSHHHLPKKANHLNQTYEKFSIQQSSDDSGNNSPLELSENDFQFSADFQTIIILASVFSFVCLLGLLGHERRNLTAYNFVVNLSTIKKFILIRSIRI